ASEGPSETPEPSTFQAGTSLDPYPVHIGASVMTTPILPDESWTTEQLQDYVLKETALSKRRGEQARLFGNRSAQHAWRAGKALMLVKPRLKAEGGYDAWLAKNKIGKTSAYRDTELARRATLDAIGDMTLTEAWRHWGITAHPKPARVNLDAEG